VSKVTPAGAVSTFATGFSPPYGLAFDAAGNLYVSQRDIGTVSEVSSGAVSVPFNLGGSAGSGTDYTGLSASPLLFAPGQTSATITGTLLANPGASPTLTFTLGTPTAGATLGSPSTNTLTITEPPAVTSISPSSGSGAGGTIVTITGVGFTGATAVMFGTTSATFIVTSVTSITAISPAGSGVVDVTVTTPGGTSAIKAADQFSYVPDVTSISPTSGPGAGGTSVTITGDGFTGATAVMFGTTAASSFTVNSATSITASSPVGSGVVDVTVTTAGSTSATSAVDQFSYVPDVTSISPTSGPGVGGTSVTITGDGFVGATAVTFGTTAASSFSVNSATSITASSPAGSGIVDVTVTTLGGTSSTSVADQFSFVPSVTSISPTSGPATGGTSVSITGTGFTGATAVMFGTTAASSFAVNSATSITVTSPAGSGVVDVTVTTAGGTSATLAADQFSFTTPPPPPPPPAALSLIAVGAGAGGGPEVKVYDAATGALRFDFFAYDPSFTGGVSVAIGDINGDGTPDIITGAGPSGGPHVKVFSGKDGSELASFFAYDPSFQGGVNVATGDINADGFADIITGAGAGGGPHVKVFSGRDAAQLASFFAYDPGFHGGVNVAAGDVNGDGFADIITGAGAGGGPHVKAFSGQDATQLASFFAYDSAFTGGVSVGSTTLSNGKAAIITGAGAGGGPHVKVFDGSTLTLLNSYFAFDQNFTGGVRVAGVNVYYGQGQIVTGAGPGGGPHVIVFDAPTQTTLESFYAFNPAFTGGVFVG
jgi:hypothetical protein